MNVIALLEFELAYYESADQYFNHYPRGHSQYKLNEYDL